MENYLNTSLFLWVIGVGGCIMVTILVVLLCNIIGMRGDLKPINSLVNEFNSFSVRSKLNELFRLGERSHHSLTPEKAIERDELIKISKQRILMPHEGERLKALLEEDARNDFRNGVIGVLALAAILVVIGAVIKGLSES